ncbi:TIR-like protein FxsC [Streptomyces sp. NPDC057621]|uniref:TIR-like protein FxsC n=1 Tax=Streptomyces sp. NPDC057621 TaxID=3346186 RepID=UPI00369C3C53
MTSNSGGIARLGALLGALDPHGLPTGPREVAELLWLAANLPAGALIRAQAPSDEGTPSATPPPSGQKAAAAEALKAAANQDDAGQEDRLYLPDRDVPGQERTRSHPASLIRVASTPVLPRRRALARSLRPLKRRVPSTTHLVIDEDATADRIADEARWMPVLAPAQDRWLDLALVIDIQGDGASLWQPLGRELLGVLQELGAFRSLRTYWLRRRHDGTPGLAANPRQAPRSAATASDPTGRTVTLLLTDGVDPGWGTGALRGMLRQWARSGPAAVLQTLPEHLWGQTALAPEPGRFRSTGPGDSSSRLHFSPYALGSRALQPGEVPLPVLAIDPQWLAPWAMAVAGTREFDGAAIRLPAGEATTVRDTTSPPPGQPVSFEEFLAQTQPGTFRLAAYLSAAPLNLAVMRLVQSSMLPDSPPSDLAEIVFSGLLQRLPTSSTDSDPLQQAYEFAPGVREHLLSTLRRDEAAQVITTVSAYVERHIPAGAARFTAAVADPDGTVLLPAGAQHWAEVQNLVRRRRLRKTPAHHTENQGPAVVRGLDMRQGPALHRAPEPAGAQLAPAPADDPVMPDRSDRRRFLITIGVSRFMTDLPELPRVPQDITRVREAFEALGYTPVLPKLANNPSTSAVMRSIEAWAQSGSVRPPDVVVVYFAGHTKVLRDGAAQLMASDSEPSTEQPSGITISRLHRVLSGHVGRAMLILDTGFPALSGVPADLEHPPLWVLSCHQNTQERSGGMFSHALTAELSRLHRSSATPDLENLAARLRNRILLDQGASDTFIKAWSPGKRYAFSRFFPTPYRPRTSAHPPLPADIVPRAEQSNVLQAITDWLQNQPTDVRPRIVTGPLASGKTTVLRLLKRQLTEPNNRDADASGFEQDERVRPVLSVLLSSIPGSANDVSRDLVLQLGYKRRSKNWISQVASYPGTVLVLLDRLHEASPGQRRSIVDTVVRPLQQLPNVRFVITDTSTQLANELGIDIAVLRLLDEYSRQQGATEDVRRQPQTTTSNRSTNIGPEYEPYFFLSYARMDNSGEFVNRFYDDLVGELRQIGADPAAQPPFRDIEGLGLGTDWARALGDAVGHCRAFIALYSPAYLNSEFCGKEWTAFRERLERYRQETDINVPALVPVTWTPVEGNLPDEVADLQYNEPGLGDEYLTRGLLHILKTDPTGPAYRKVVERVAAQVRIAADRFRLPITPSLDLGEVRGLFPAFTHQRLAEPGTTPSEAEQGLRPTDATSYAPWALERPRPVVPSATSEEAWTEQARPLRARPASSSADNPANGSENDRDLTHLVHNTRFTIFGFDGPICRLFAGYPADQVAHELVEWLDAQGLQGILTEQERVMADPKLALRAVERRHPGSDLVAELEERLTQQEMRAASTAMPTPYADPLIRTWAELGARLAVTTNNSPQAVRHYLDNRRLTDFFAPHIYGRSQNLANLKPHPHLINRALLAMNASPQEALMIGDTPVDLAASQQAGIAFLGYARNAHQQETLRNAGAQVVVNSLDSVLRALRQ